jgi:hypothetical protein
MAHIKLYREGGDTWNQPGKKRRRREDKEKEKI